MPEINNGLSCLTRINIKIDSQGLRTINLRLDLMDIIRLRAITITLKSLLFSVSLYRIEIEVRLTNMYTGARQTTFLGRNFLLLRSISGLIENIIISFNYIYIFMTWCVTYRLSDRGLRARTSTRANCIVLTYMTYNRCFTISAALTRAENSGSTVMANGFLTRVLFISIIERR